MKIYPKSKNILYLCFLIIECAFAFSVGFILHDFYYKKYKKQDIFVREALDMIVNLEDFKLSYGPNRIPFLCVDSVIPKIRSKKITTKNAFDLCKEELKKIIDTRHNATDNHFFAIFLAIVSSRLAPYGNSNAIKIDDIYNEKYLNCAQHANFIKHEMLEHVSGEGYLINFGIDGGSIGNHAMIFFSENNVGLLLDGTTSVVAFVDFDKLFGGKLISVFDMYDFYSKDDEALEIFRRNLRGSLRFGSIRENHVIYKTKHEIGKGY
jgi:hypothetical protein